MVKECCDMTTHGRACAHVPYWRKNQEVWLDTRPCWKLCPLWVLEEYDTREWHGHASSRARFYLNWRKYKDSIWDGIWACSKLCHKVKDVMWLCLRHIEQKKVFFWRKLENSSLRFSLNLQYKRGSKGVFINSLSFRETLLKTHSRRLKDSRI